jgi:peptidoglycan/LPS O-acetylase OafA/YrhL
MTIQQSNSNVPILDSLRAFAAISVCLFHFVYTTKDFIHTTWILDIFSVGKYGVQTFFVISGFIIPWSMYQAKFEIRYFFKFALKRFSRLEPPYITSILIAIVIFLGRDYFLNLNNFKTEVTSTRILLHFGYCIPFFENYNWFNKAYWTLAIEFQYYFFIALLYVPLINSNLLLRIIIGLSVIALSFIGDGDFLLYWLPVFYIGIIVFMYKGKKSNTQYEFWITLFLLIIFCLFKYSFASVVYMIIPVMAIVFFNQYKIPVLNFFGKMSYSIYIIGGSIGGTFVNILSHQKTTDLGKFCVIMVGLTITLISSYISYFLIEKPSKKIASSIKYKK